MKTFQEFLEEGKKTRIKTLAKKIQKNVKKDIKQQRKENPDKIPIADYGNPSLGSDKHLAAIHAMMATDSAWREKMRKKQQNDNN